MDESLRGGVNIVFTQSLQSRLLIGQFGNVFKFMQVCLATSYYIHTVIYYYIAIDRMQI